MLGYGLGGSTENPFTFGDSPEATDNASLLRILSDVQALLAAQRRIEWKLSGLAKAQLAVTSTLDGVKEEMSSLRGQLATGGLIPPADMSPRARATSDGSEMTIKRTMSRTATAIRNMARTGAIESSSKPRDPYQDSPVQSAVQSPVARMRPAELEEFASPNTAMLMVPTLTPRSVASPMSPTRSRQTAEEEILRLRRNDGRFLVQLGRWKKTWGSARTTPECRLPAMEVQAGDERGAALDRLLDVRLTLLAPGIHLDGSSEEVVDNRQYSRFGLKSTKRFHQTVFNATMDENFQTPKQCIVLTAGSFTPTKGGRSSPRHLPAQDIIGTWDDDTVFLFAWLTADELEHYSSSNGDNLLSQWISKAVIDEEALQRNISL